MKDTQEYIKRLEELTNKNVALIEADEPVKKDEEEKEQEVKLDALQNQLGSMAKLNERFKTKEFVPSKEIFHLNRYKYEFKRAKPDSLDSVKLLSKDRGKLDVVYICRKEKSTVTFTYTTGDGLLQPSKAVLEK